MKAKLNSNLFPLIRVGMYDDRLSPENVIDDEWLKEDGVNVHEYWDKFDRKKYVKGVEETAKTHSGNFTAEGIDINVQFGEIYSPKYYNFETDQIEFEVEYDKGLVMRYAFENRDEFDEFLKENYSSYDGFISHTANTYDEWIEDFKCDNVQSIGAVLTFIFRDELEDEQERFFERCNERLIYSDFV